MPSIILGIYHIMAPPPSIMRSIGFMKRPLMLNGGFFSK
jgi:hypothetical protein